MYIRSWFFYIFPLILVFMLSPVFFELLPIASSTIYGSFKKVVYALALVYSFFQYRKMSSFVRGWFFLSLAMFGLMMLESYGEYRELFVYPHVFSKILSIFFIFFIYTFYKANPGTVKLKHIVFVILLAFTLNLFFIESRFLNLTAGFLTRERLLDSHSAYLMLLPFFYFFNRYLQTRNFFHVILLLGATLLIILLQYRTLWVAIPIGMALNLFLLGKAKDILHAPVLLPFFTIGLFLFGLALYLLPGDDKVVTVFIQNIQDIVKTGERLTHDWRWLQFAHYWPIIKENFWLGLRFEGFEVPVMIMDYTDNYSLQEAGSGHWFHSFYIDKMFYLGFVGLILFIAPPFLYIFQRLNKAVVLNIEQLTMASFVVTGLLYGISYVWPLHFYALLGFAMYALDAQKPNPQNEATETLTVTVPETTAEG